VKSVDEHLADGTLRDRGMRSGVRGLRDEPVECLIAVIDAADRTASEESVSHVADGALDRG